MSDTQGPPIDFQDLLSRLDDMDDNLKKIVASYVKAMIPRAVDGETLRCIDIVMLASIAYRNKGNALVANVLKDAANRMRKERSE